MASVTDLLTFDNEVFRSYVFWTSVLTLKMLLMAGLTGYHRLRTNTYPNAEDAAQHGVAVRFGQPDVERSRRAHRNDLEYIPVHLIVGLLYVLTAPAPAVAVWLFRAAGCFRLLHTVVYAMWVCPQPARGICFGVPCFITGYMLLQTLRLSYD